MKVFPIPGFLAQTSLGTFAQFLHVRSCFSRTIIVRRELRQIVLCGMPANGGQILIIHTDIVASGYQPGL